MNVTIRTHHVSITKPIKEYVEKKLGKLDRYFSNILEIAVDLDVSEVSDFEDRQSVSATVWVPNSVFRAKETSRDMYASVDLVFEKLEKQLKKHKGKIKNHNRHGENRTLMRKFSDIFSSNDKSMPDTDTPSKHYIPKPMYREDVRLIMDERAVDFLMFHNAETDTINVIYRNENNNINFIEPH